jgi:uncharacterized membrane protein
MALIQRAIDVEAGRDRVFALLTDLDRLPEWATIVVETRDVSELPLRPGCRFRQTLRVVGRELESEWRVTELEAERRISYEATAPGGGSMTMRQTVTPRDGGSRVQLEIDYELPGGLLGELVDRAFVEEQNEREADRSLANLKELLDGQAAE